jgi:hypothetical protein
LGSLTSSPSMKTVPPVMGDEVAKDGLSWPRCSFVEDTGCEGFPEDVFCDDDEGQHGCCFQTGWC